MCPSFFEYFFKHCSTRYCRILLYFNCPNHGISHLHREPWFLSVESNISEPGRREFAVCVLCVWGIRDRDNGSWLFLFFVFGVSWCLGLSMDGTRKWINMYTRVFALTLPVPVQHWRIPLQFSPFSNLSLFADSKLASIILFLINHSLCMLLPPPTPVPMGHHPYPTCTYHMKVIFTQLGSDVPTGLWYNHPYPACCTGPPFLTDRPLPTWALMPHPGLLSCPEPLPTPLPCLGFNTLPATPSLRWRPFTEMPSLSSCSGQFSHIEHPHPSELQYPGWATPHGHASCPCWAPSQVTTFLTRPGLWHPLKDTTAPYSSSTWMPLPYLVSPKGFSTECSGKGRKLYCF